MITSMGSHQDDVQINGHRPSTLLRTHRDEILRILAKYPMLSNLRVFGSVARGDDTPASDLDVIVDTATGTTLFDLGGFSEDLQDALGVRVDVVTSADTMNAVVREHIFKEATPV